MNMAMRGRVSVLKAELFFAGATYAYMGGSLTATTHVAHQVGQCHECAVSFRCHYRNRFRLCSRGLRSRTGSCWKRGDALPVDFPVINIRLVATRPLAFLGT